MNEEDVKKIKDKYTSQFLQLKGVVGVGIGKIGANQQSIEILVIKKLPEHDKLIPKSLEGIPTRIREVGVIKALEINDN